MGYMLPSIGLTIVIAIVVFTWVKTWRQNKELKITMGEPRKRLREMSRNAKQIEGLDARDMSEMDRKVLAQLIQTLDKLKGKAEDRHGQ